ncbi:hypothetical protein [Priestia aryabhattai]|uniref:hypothetical protein n=1 Tax=Priestia aryabhattai TaxID=412384 RepID=UPI001593CF1F
MKPKDLLNFYIKTDLLPLLEPLGFKYAKSTPKFSRKTGHFNLSLSFVLVSMAPKMNTFFGLCGMYRQMNMGNGMSKLGILS